MQQNTQITGTIDAVFAHRFVVVTDDGRKVLADLSPTGVGLFDLQAGTKVVLDGEMKPFELKVSSIPRDGGSPVFIEHGKPDHAKHHGHGDADPKTAMAAVEKAGVAVVGEPRRKLKHFEVLGTKYGRHVEHHVAFDGSVRKEKPVVSDDDKWAAELKSVA